jgi:hypothetical protein
MNHLTFSNTLLGLALMAMSTVVLSKSSTVTEFVAAYNQADADKMLKLVTEDVKWISIEAEKSTLITKNKDELKEALQQQFSGETASHSELLVHTQKDAYIQTIEKAFWHSTDGLKSQCSAAVYQLEGAKIKHIWYFPSYTC